jgi:L-lactate dehydrogenase complex protein LldG
VSRDTVLGRIRAAISERASRPDAPTLPASRPVGDPVGVFAERARELGVAVEAVTLEAMPARVAVWCAERNVRCVLVWDTPQMGPVREALDRARVRIVGQQAPIDDLAAADAGITGAEWGIAETGTLVLATDPMRPRLTSLLPPRHLAVIRADRIVSDLPALFDHCGVLPSALTLISGPSRSADIGFVPVLGAHGPMEVAVLVVDG